MPVPPFSWIDKALDKTVGATTRFVADFINWRRRGARLDILDLDRMAIETAKAALVRAESQGSAAETKEAQESLRLAEQTLISDIEQQRNRLREAAGYYLEERVPQGPVSAAPSLPPGVKEDLQKLIAMAEQKLLPQPETAEEHFFRGNAHFESGNYEEALAAYDRVLDLHPDNPNLHVNRGVVLGKLERYEEALASLRRAVEIKQGMHEALDNWGVVLVDQAKTKEGEEADRLFGEAYEKYGQALELQPDNPSALYNRACLFSLEKKPDEALDDLRRAIAGDAKYRGMARDDEDFDNIRGDPRFSELWPKISIGSANVAPGETVVLDITA